MKKIIDPLRKILLVISSSILITCLITLTWQVVSRYLTKSPSTFTEELSRILLVCLAVTGSTLAFLEHKHMSADVLMPNASPRMKKFLTEFSAVMIVIFGIILICGGIMMIKAKWSLGQTSPVMGLKLVYLYFLLPFSGLIICLSPFYKPEEGE